MGPAALIGAGVGTAAVTTIGATLAYDAAARRADDRTKLADGTVTAGTIGMFLAGGALIAGGAIALTRGTPNLATAGMLAIAGGFGLATGALVSNGVYHWRHGATVESVVDGVLNQYDHNNDDELDLEGSRWWGLPETIRRVERCTDDPDSPFDDCEYDYYSIDRLARKANANHDEVVTRDELVSYIGSFDTNPTDGRIVGDESRKLDREAGERAIYGWGL